MKKIIAAAILISFMGLCPVLFAQQEKTEKKEQTEKKELAEKKEFDEKIEKQETEEIIIRNKSGKDMNLKIDINGDKVTVNGKPLEDFIDGEVTINKRKIVIRKGGREMNFDFNADDMHFERENINGATDEVEILPFLGVTTEKAEGGAKITAVSKSSSAEKAGLKKDDIITKVGDKLITDAEGLAEGIAAKKPGEAVQIGYKRNGKRNSVKAILGERKTNRSMAFNHRLPGFDVREFAYPHDVEAFSENGDQLKRLYELESMAPRAHFNKPPFMEFENGINRQKKLGIKIQDTEEGGNVKVIEVAEGSTAEKAGLKKDDIITEIGGVKIDGTDIAREQLMLSAPKSSYNIKAKRGNTDMDFEVKIPKKLKTADL